MAQEDWIPRLQFRHGYMIAFSQYEGPANHNRSGFEKTPEAYSGEMTRGAKKRVRRCVDLLLQISPEHIIFNPVTKQYQPFSVNFITLTIPVEKTLSASWCHKNLLEPFIRTMRRKHGLRHYIWKCERQERGQIHYHFTTDTFIIWSDIRNVWNNQLRSAGLMKEFILKHKHADPNSTDVHAVYKIKNVAAYICKYIAKTVSGQPLDGKVWDASTALKNAKLYTTTPSGSEQTALTQLTASGKIACIETEHCKIYKPIKCTFNEMFSETTRTEYEQYVHTLARSYHVQTNIELSS